MTAGPINLPLHAVYPGGQAVPIYKGNATRINATSSGSATGGAAIPTVNSVPARLLAVRATQSIWLKFGTSSGVAATADNASELFIAGERVIPVPDGTTHFSVLQVDTTGTVQLEMIA